jgi:hypothetical protein
MNYHADIASQLCERERLPNGWKTRKELEDNPRLEELINTRHHFIASIPPWEMITPDWKN